MAQDLIRILSDLHYGDRASRIGALPSLQPLLEGVTTLVLNGDTLDTRPSRAPERTAAVHTLVREFFQRHAPTAIFLTGNHDPDISDRHTLELAGGEVFVTHGDIIFDDIVPWGRDARLVRERIALQLAALTPAARERLEDRLAAFRRAAASIPQRHQSERQGFKYAVGYAADTVWPPQRMLRVLRAWHETPGRTDRLVRRHRPQARFAIIGHIHRPGAWRTPGGTVVISTGSFCPPLGGWMVDLSAGRLTVRRVARRAGEFRPGGVVAEFALAQT